MTKVKQRKKTLSKEKSLDFLVTLTTRMIAGALNLIPAKPKFSLAGSRMDHLEVSLTSNEDGHSNKCRIFMDIFTRTRSRLHVCCVVLWREGKWNPQSVDVTIFSNIHHVLSPPACGRYRFTYSFGGRSGKSLIVTRKRLSA